MLNGNLKIRKPSNEPVMNYAPGSPEREDLKAHLERILKNPVEVPCIIGGKEVRTGDVAEMIPPHNFSQSLGKYHKAGEKEVKDAVQAAGEAWKEWSELDWIHRASIILRAAELLSGKYRMVMNAATMLCVSKTCHQAEIDSACELIDFWRFNAYYMTKVLDEQPLSTVSVMNYVEQRPLEGFIFAVTPFNFAAIAGNLPTAPAIMGNTTVWKPASAAVLPAFYIMKILKEAGMPDGVINMIPGSGPVVGPMALNDPHLGGVHFTGSTAVFADIWKTIGQDILKYKTYPRIVGETGGKDFIFVHSSADVDEVVTAMVRGAFEYQGQKCSAASRAYVPDSLWPKIKQGLMDEVATVKVGDIMDFTNYMGAVIDEKAFRNITAYIEHARENSGFEILCGGDYDDSDGYFIQPTVIVSEDPASKLMSEEIFGPVITIYVYPEKEYERTLDLCDNTSPYGLTGAIFAHERYAALKALKILRHAAGNFYFNDKPTGAVVGQQPFGGSRASGTNDKAGSIINLMRWVSPRSIKENLTPPVNYRYPFMKK